jgi:hypothetical protein
VPCSKAWQSFEEFLDLVYLAVSSALIMSLPLVTSRTAGKQTDTILKKLRPHVSEPPELTVEEATSILSLIFSNELSSVKSAIFLHDLAITGLEQRPDILAGCASVMRHKAVPVDVDRLTAAVEKRSIGVNGYGGGLVRFKSNSDTHSEGKSDRHSVI